MTIAVVDYGMGNLRSVSKALEHVALDSQTVTVTANPDVINAAERVVFPGQGAARDCMQHLEQRKLVEVVKKAAHEKPFLGICMGLQVLMTHSEENNGVDCMGLYQGEVKAFADPALAEVMQAHKIPHMGWNAVSQKQDHPMWQGVQDNSRFYFVHSYYVSPEAPELVAGSTEYGMDFVSVVAQNNVFATQFHPEKSAHDGLQLLSNFCRWDGTV